MSTKYDEYLREHREGVVKGLQWMDEHLRGRGLFELSDLSTAQYMAEHHDESKDSIEEYEAYDRYFYGGNRSSEVVNGFNYAWLHHIHRNPHHWQYWVLINDDEEDGTIALEMPVCYVLEMIADWWTFSWRTGNLEEIFDWYDKHRERIIFHKKTKALVEKILEAIRKELNDNKVSDTKEA